jgi:Zn-dependent protease with chaperone function
LILHCGKCGAEAPEELGFCVNCKTRFIPRNAYDLQLSDFAYGPDQSAIESLKVTGPLPYIIKNLTVTDLEKKMLSKLSREAHRVTYPSLLDTMIRHCAMTLGLDSLPDVFVVEGGEPNAFTFGSEEKACLVVYSSLLESANEIEQMAVLGHELGHVKSGHMLYHTLAEVLGRGASLSASFFGLNIISIPIQLALLSWHRESEVTADRASLLVVRDVDVVTSLLRKLALSPDSVVEQNVAGEPGVLESVSELFRTHPILSKRIKLVKEFAKSSEFLRAKKKIELQQTVLRGLLPFCRYCGTKKTSETLFCPACRKAQV